MIFLSRLVRLIQFFYANKVQTFVTPNTIKKFLEVKEIDRMRRHIKESTEDTVKKICNFPEKLRKSCVQTLH